MTVAAVTIRFERPEDVDAVRVVNAAAFGRPAEASLVDALRAHGRVAHSLVAESEERIVGHILLSPVSLDPPSASLRAVGLAPMAVLPRFQRRAIGSLLVHGGLEACRRSGYDYVVVLGHPTYYPRFGFVPAERFGLRCGFDAPTGAFMALELRRNALPVDAALVRYQPEFEAL